MDEQTPAEFGQVFVDEAIELSASGTLLVDVREQYEWDTGHAPTAILLPLSELRDRFEELPRDQTLLLVCHSGQRSLTASSMLANAGYHTVNVIGGMSAWHRAGGPMVAEGSEPPRA
jgi:rhodanese-related sulfurtransferase